MIKNKVPKNVLVFIKVMSGLSERERFILTERYENHKKMREVGKSINVTPQRIREIENKIIEEIELAFKYANV